MVQYVEKYKQNIAIEMRKRGLSYSEIENRLHVPKSTLSFWLKKIKLTQEQIKKLNDKRVKTAKANALRKTSKTSKLIEEIKSTSSLDIKKISKKELWLTGIVLYWKNGNKSDLKKGVHFSSSNPDMIRLFLKWLKEVGGVRDDEIRFDIFAGKNKKNLVDKVNSYWSRATGFPKSCFRCIYFQKSKNSGFLRVKVAQSSMLARQIAGWIEGFKKINNL
ncbi:MAG: hypothetical protein A2651_00950 [Candidatus Yanofskybacteria bacterium RIFCSPHIGHO2_01_FULL_42_12]|uniref:Uncharacterized protein n=1 Tax=Candidatus Yanofskybacteria bacterium RIFCSPLOWO2_01_FULL_42_49 TaxID=1802694 RepID=A0A1F8GE35_9BACT|nr:MAG: hypothetical protein A2651_00950 [Candidatus Yanofskybacteria bacterium RIFCSPHIGHO2_01_FULL_42_12]OGN23583.1 MAG: hypothetical protein A2918_00730 [Candidatus Yanofskybacteria bacterium RIFCSPLOWO2_01_FULL_42_49]